MLQREHHNSVLPNWILTLNDFKMKQHCLNDKINRKSKKKCSTRAQKNRPVFHIAVVPQQSRTIIESHYVGRWFNFSFFLLWWEFVRSTLASYQMDETVLLSALTMLYIISPWHLFFNRKFVPLDHLYPFCPLLTPCLWQSPTCSLYLWVRGFVYLF